MISTPLFGVPYRSRKVSRLSTPLLGLGALTVSSDRTPDPKFDSILINAVDETMADLFGPVVVQSLHEHLLKFYHVRTEEIPYRLDSLTFTLERTFGASSKIICKAIVRKFYAKLGLAFYDNPARTLLESVEQARIKRRGSGGQL